MTWTAAANRGLARLQLVARLAWITSGLTSLTLLFLSDYKTGSGGPMFRWLLAMTGQDSFVLGLSAAAFTLFELSVAAAIALMVLRWLVRWRLLASTDPVIGTVVSVRRTGMTVNNCPMMAIQVRVGAPVGPAITTARKLLDLGSIPRKGDRVRVDVSRLDRTCAAYRGPA